MTSAGTAISARTVIEVTVTRVTPGTFVVVPNEASVNSAIVYGLDPVTAFALDTH